MDLCGAERYQPEKVEQVEKLIEDQNSSYSLDAYLALLRFYQITPSLVKMNILSKILLKGLVQLPMQDFKTCIHLVPEKFQEDDHISKIVQLASALETSRFGEFWELYNSNKDMLAIVPGFADAIRSFITAVLSITFQKVPKTALGEYLQLQGADLDDLVAKKVKSDGWVVVNGSAGTLIQLPKSDYNQQMVKRTQELISFDQVSPVLRVATVSV